MVVMYVCMCVYIYIHTHTHTHTHRVSQAECARLREGVPYVKIYRYNPKHLYPKSNGYGYNGQRSVWSSGGSTHCTLSADRSASLSSTAVSDYRNNADAAAVNCLTVDNVVHGAAAL